MNDNLGPAILPFVELVIRILGICQSNLMGDDETRFGLASNDHIPEVSIVCFHIALASANRKTLLKCQMEAELILSEGKITCLLEQLSKAQADHAVRRRRIRGTRVTVWNEKSGDKANRVYYKASYLGT